MSENIGKNEETAKATTGKDTGTFPGWPQWDKYEWPELVGKDGETAKAIILSENPKLYVQILKTDENGVVEPRPGNISPTRVFVVVDVNGLVSQTPKIG